MVGKASVGSKAKKYDEIYEEYLKLISISPAKTKKKKVSSRQAIKQLSIQRKINFFTLKGIIETRNTNKTKFDKKHKNMKFTISQENQLLGVIRSFQTHAYPLNNTTVINLARTSFGIDDKWVGKTWLTNFKKRNNLEINDSQKKKICKDRINISVLQGCREFGAIWSAELRENQYSDFQIFNCDETLVDIQKADKKNTSITSLSVPNVQGSYGGKLVVSILPFVSASGVVLMVVYIVPAEINEDGDAKVLLTVEKDKRLLRGDYPKYYAFSKTGYVNNQLWISIYQQFIERKKLIFQNQKIVLLMDRLMCHTKEELLLKSINENINVVFFPPHSSHFLQPLDDKVYGNLKNFLVELTSRNYFIKKKNNIGISNIVNSVLPQLEERAFTPKIIKASFRDTGVFPYVFDTIEKNAKKHLYDPLFTLSKPSNLIEETEKQINKIFDSKVPQKKKQKTEFYLKRDQCFTSSQFIQLSQEESKKKEAALLEKQYVKETKEQNKLEKQILKEQRKQEREEKKKAKLVEIEKKKEEKKKKKKANSCQVCDKNYRTGSPWEGCEHCDVFWVCPDCAKSSDVIENHEFVCKNAD